eukprot:TRINITY_DN2680_c0_g1_i2.p1 TRINITY_DN2680_c0_g1~~TRINITY_DN2680_c0_g1_i2.p1  ORF type:complete len:959 (+),score=340.05 TRINITY_DN2680_c0_g1_i2:866-3742(+)
MAKEDQAVPATEEAESEDTSAAEHAAAAVSVEENPVNANRAEQDEADATPKRAEKASAPDSSEKEAATAKAAEDGTRAADADERGAGTLAATGSVAEAQEDDNVGVVEAIEEQAAKVKAENEAAAKKSAEEDTAECTADDFAKAKERQTATSAAEAFALAKEDAAAAVVKEAEADGASAAEPIAATEVEEHAAVDNKDDKDPAGALAMPTGTAPSLPSLEKGKSEDEEATTEADKLTAVSITKETAEAAKDEEGTPLAEAAQEQAAAVEVRDEAASLDTGNTVAAAKATDDTTTAAKAEGVVTKAVKDDAVTEAAKLESEDGMANVETKDVAAGLAEEEADEDKRDEQDKCEAVVPVDKAQAEEAAAGEDATAAANAEEYDATTSKTAKAVDQAKDSIEFEKELPEAEAHEHIVVQTKLYVAAVAARGAQETAVMDEGFAAVAEEVEEVEKQASPVKAGDEVLAAVADEAGMAAAAVIVEEGMAAACQTEQDTEVVEAVDNQAYAAKAEEEYEADGAKVEEDRGTVVSDTGKEFIAAATAAEEAAHAARAGREMAPTEEKAVEEATMSATAEGSSKVAAQADDDVEDDEDASYDFRLSLAVAKATEMVEEEATAAVAKQVSVFDAEEGAGVGRMAWETAETDKSVTEGPRVKNEDSEEELPAAEGCGADSPLRVRPGNMPSTGDTTPHDTETVLSRHSSKASAIRQQATEEQPVQVSVQLSENCSTLGLALQQRASRAGPELVVVEVLADGAVAAHNAEQLASRREDKLVKPGMRLAGVNGVERDVTTLLEALVAEHVADVFFVQVAATWNANGAAMAVRALREHTSDASRDEFKVRLKKGSQGLGLTFKAPIARRRERQGLLIVDIDPLGAVADHNMSKHLEDRNDLIIRPRMYIIAVNGIADDAGAMMEALRENNELELRIRSEEDKLAEWVPHQAKAVHTVKAVRTERLGLTANH